MKRRLIGFLLGIANTAVLLSYTNGADAAELACPATSFFCVSSCTLIPDTDSYCEFQYRHQNCLTASSYCERDEQTCSEDLLTCYDYDTGMGNPFGPFCNPNHVECDMIPA